MRGNTALVILIILAFVAISIAALFHFKKNSKVDFPIIQAPSTHESKENITWKFDGENWQSTGNRPACPNPLVLPSPVNVENASGILYPGQIRGGDYKPHGGFRFDKNPNNKVEVRAIMDGYILKAAKYHDGYEEQISIFFVNDCGLMVMHDHILVPSPKLAEALKDVPSATGGDSRTTNVKRVDFKKGEVLATEIGYPNFPGGNNGKNIFVDFGLYDLRQKNGVNYDSQFRSNHPNINEYGTYALCWLEYLEKPAKTNVKNLPAGGNEGKTSDYCT